MPTCRQFTLRELMVLVLLAALGIAGLFAGGLLSSIVVAAAIVATMAMAIVAFVGRGWCRAFSVGFVIPVLAYCTFVILLGESELDPYQGKLPTSKLTKLLYEQIVRREYVDAVTGKPLPDYDPATDPGHRRSGFGVTPVGFRETPDRSSFMSLAHAMLAMTLGYVGAKFAVWVDCQQPKGNGDGDRPTAESETP